MFGQNVSSKEDRKLLHRGDLDRDLQPKFQLCGLLTDPGVCIQGHTNLFQLCHTQPVQLLQLLL